MSTMVEVVVEALSVVEEALNGEVVEVVGSRSRKVLRLVEVVAALSVVVGSRSHMV